MARASKVEGFNQYGQIVGRKQASSACHPAASKRAQTDVSVYFRKQRGAAAIRFRVKAGVIR